MHNTLPLTAANLPATNLMGVAHHRAQRGDYTIATVSVAILSLIFVACSNAVFHWFLLPAMACGILVGVDIVRWLRGRLELFDPRTIIACLAFYGFFVAPILHVIWDRFGVGDEMIMSGDWRPWLGAMAVLNALGLLAYRLAQNRAFSRTTPSQTSWKIN